MFSIRYLEGIILFKNGDGMMVGFITIFLMIMVMANGSIYAADKSSKAESQIGVSTKEKSSIPIREKRKRYTPKKHIPMPKRSPKYFHFQFKDINPFNVPGKLVMKPARKKWNQQIVDKYRIHIVEADPRYYSMKYRMPTLDAKILERKAEQDIEFDAKKVVPFYLYKKGVEPEFFFRKKNPKNPRKKK